MKAAFQIMSLFAGEKVKKRLSSQKHLAQHAAKGYLSHDENELNFKKSLGCYTSSSLSDNHNNVQIMFNTQIAIALAKQNHM